MEIASIPWTIRMAAAAALGSLPDLKYEDARKHFLDARKLNQGWLLNLAWLGKTDLKLGKLDEAEAALKVIQPAPTVALSRWRLNRVLCVSVFVVACVAGCAGCGERGIRLRRGNQGNRAGEEGAQTGGEEEAELALRQHPAVGTRSPQQRTQSTRRVQT